MNAIQTNRGPAAIGAIAGALAGLVAFFVLQATGPDSATGGEQGLQPAAAPLSASVGTGADAGAEAGNPALTMRLATLTDEVERLGDRLLALESRRQVADPSPALEARDGDTLVAATPTAQRTLVLDLLEEERAREEEEQRANRSARELAQAEDRADRIAEELELSGAERDTLATILSDEAEARLELVETLRDLDPGDRDARQAMVEQFGTLREATAGEIELRLGLERAEQIEARGNDRRGPGGFGGGGFGRRRGG
ncbi:MAG: hypothetical protein AAFZ65_16765 [Planctomycetota bacterium]